MAEELTDWTIEEFSFTIEPPRPSEDQSHAWKMLYFKIGMIASIAIVFISLINLEIVNGAKLQTESNTQRIFVETLPAPRGIIYDRNHIPLVYNIDTYKVVIDTNIFDPKNQGSEFASIANLLHIPVEQVSSIYTKGIVAHEDVITVQDNINKDQVIALSTDPIYKGIRAESSTIRQYPYIQYTAAILGYTGGVSESDLHSNAGLNSQDTIGKAGIEAQYDTALRGVDGQKIVEVNTLGQVVNVIKEEDPIPGNNIILSLDINVQKNLSDALALGIKDSSATGGASIIQNINDGSIIAMVTLPTYDNNKFAQGISQSDYASLLNDPNTPLINRAISEAQPPGSVMKTITASAALQEKDITTSTLVDDKGTFDLGGIVFQNYEKIARGIINVIGGLQWSSNVFFYNVIHSYLNINTFVKYEKLFGAGSLTGIDLPGEQPGELSSPQVKQELTGQVWFGGDSLNAAIGQGYTLVTPIQVVNWITSIANGGTLFKPQMVSRIENGTSNAAQVFNGSVVRQGFVDDKYLSIVRQGMHVAVQSGIDHTLYTSAVDIAGKTGTAEFGALDAYGQYTHEHAWASGFAPYDKPQISFVVFLEGGGLSSNSERVAKSFLTWYYGTYLKQNSNNL